MANDPIVGTPYQIQDILVKPYTRGNAFGTPNSTSPYHYKIDFTKPGAQAYINSVAGPVICAMKSCGGEERTRQFIDSATD